MRKGRLAEKGAPRLGSVALLYTVTLFASAFLMFLVQPMFAKMVLPRLGGSAMVWSLALVFFQTVLLLGYGYAHLMVRWLGLRLTVIVQVLVCVGAVASLPVAIAAGWEEAPQQGQAFWVLGLFAASVGLPFFALSANAPLLQSWFARAGQARSRDPYFLYAASNAGSLVALLAYPFAVEPLFGLFSQGRGWGLGFAILIVMIALCGVVALRAAPADGAEAERRTASAPLDWGQRLSWMVFAFLPTGLLVGATAFITMDLVSAPFIWVIPLAIYLLTFVIAFQVRPVVAHGWLMKWIGLLGTALAIFALPAVDSLYLLPLHLVLCFLLMLACHGELARRRPDPTQLTEFYFFVSLGGVLGGMFASLLAPVLFNSVVEYPLLIIATMGALGLAKGGRAALTRLFWVSLAGLPVVVALFYGYLELDGNWKTVLIVIWTLVLTGWLAAGRRQPLVMAVLLFAVFVCLTRASGDRQLYQTRGFYGVLSVKEENGGHFHRLSHGTTMHGLQRITEDDGSPVQGRPQPRAYYYAQGPFGSAIHHYREAQGESGGRLTNVALVGMGVGSLLCFSEPGENWSFYEIDPQVVAVASDTRFFTLLRDCGPAAGITIGDGRQELAHVADGTYDIIVLDAFSSDSIPAHLLTLEAMELYMAKLKPGGIALFHTSNRFMELNSVVEGAARQLGLAAWHSVYDSSLWPLDAANGDVLPNLVVVANTAGSVPGLDADPGWMRAQPVQETAPWTDDYSNVLGAIGRQFRR